MSKLSKPFDNAPHTNEFWMKKALQLAGQAAALNEVPVGALLVIDNKIVASAFNRREQWNTPLGHAEMICIHRASQKLGRWRLSDATLYVTLEPCVMCAGLLVQSRLGRLVYGARDPKGGGIHSLYQIASDARLNHRLEVIPDILKQPCGDVLSQFFREKRLLKNRKNNGEDSLS
jgi:tRNA(adenine34) deaminase